MSKRARDLFPIFLGNKRPRMIVLSPIARVPIEIIAIILAMACISTETMLAMRTVCREWSKEIPRSPQCWKYIEYQSRVCSLDLHRMISKVAHSLCWNEDEGYHRETAPLCRRLKITSYRKSALGLTLAGFTSILHQIDELTIAHPIGFYGEILGPMHCIQRLVLTTAYIQPLIARMAPLSFMHVTHLTLDPRRDYPLPIKLNTIAQACPRLEVMKLRGVSVIEYRAMEVLPLSSVKRLTMINCNYDEPLFVRLFTCLTVLRMKKCYIHAYSANYIARCIPSLSKLIVGKYWFQNLDLSRCTDRVKTILKLEEKIDVIEDCNFGEDDEPVESNDETLDRSEEAGDTVGQATGIHGPEEGVDSESDEEEEEEQS
jgi:hypothetical protein